MSTELDKPKSLAINPKLHRYLKLLSAILRTRMNEMTEPVLWELVKANRERLEQVLEEPVILAE